MSESAEIIADLLSSIGQDIIRTESLSLLEQGDSRYLRDLKLNFKSATICISLDI